ncbi:hypothetical protein LLG07_00395 [bacterium]|nr:hypothetical protein [bacterium]
MSEEKSSEKKSAADNFGEMFKEFGSAVAEIFNDPELKSKAKDFGESVKESAKEFASRFKDDEVKGKFKDVGKAAHNFGESVSDFFRQDKDKESDSSGAASSENNEDKNQHQEDEDSKKKLDAESAEAQAGQDKETKKPEIEISGSNYDSYKKNDSQTALKEFDGRFDNYFKSPKAGRITGYVFAVIFSLAWMIFINFFNRFIAFYDQEIINGVETLRIIPILSNEFRYWLPFFTISIAVGILGNIVLIIYERFYLVKIISIITNLFFVAAAAALLKLFPFDYSQIPIAGLKTASVPITIAVLVIIIVVVGIGMVVDFIKLVVFFSRSGSVKE